MRFGKLLVDGSGAFDGIDKDLRAENAVDVTGVITEEDTTERREGADEVGLPCDGGFDAFDIWSVSEPDVGRCRSRLLLVSGRHGVW